MAMPSLRLSGPVLRAAAPALAKSLAQSFLVIAASWLASRIAGPAIGSLVLLAGSFALMVRTFRKEWRLGLIACLLPPVCAGASYAAQLGLVGDAGVYPQEELILPVVGVGLALGYLRGRTHSVFVRNGSVFAQRTFGYLFLWVACFAVTQIFALARARNLMEYSLLGGLFSTTMLLVVALVLLRKRSREMAALSAAAAALVVMVIGRPAPVDAQSSLCGLVPQMPDLVGRAANRLSATTCVFDDSKVPVRYTVRLDAYSSAEAAHDAFLARRAEADGGDVRLQDTSVAFADEAFEHFSLRSVLMVAGQTARRHHYIVSVMSDADGVGTARNVLLGTLQNLDGLTPAAAPPPPEGGQDRLVSPGEPIIPDQTFTDIFDPEAVREAWWDAILPRGAIGFTDDFGSDLVSEAAIEATALAAIGLILTCIGLTVSESVQDAAAAGQVEPAPKRIVDTSALIDWDGEALHVQDGSGRWLGGQIGQVWYDEQWMDRRRVEELIRQRTAERQRELDGQERDRQGYLRAARQNSDDALDRMGRAGAAEERRIAGERATAEHAKAVEQQKIDHILDKITRATLEGDASMSTYLDAVSNARHGDTDGLESIYREWLGRQISANESLSTIEQRWAALHGLGETGAGWVVAGAKAQLAVVGGPVGVAPVLLGTGLISAAGEGTESYVAGDPVGKVVAKTAAGFLSGAKDAATGIYSNLPGVGAAAKVLVSAGADAAETYARTGDGGKALASGTISGVSTIVGFGTDAVPAGAAKEATKIWVGGVAGGATSVFVNDKSFAEGYWDGIQKSAAGRVGSRIGEGQVAARSPEAGVRAALAEARRAADVEIPLNEQPKIIQDQLRTARPAVDGEGRPIVDADGRQKMHQDAKATLDGLRDTRANRTAKQLPPELARTIVESRNDLIYGPAHASTIAEVQPRLETEGILKPGARIEMDAFPTPVKPGERPKLSVGADLDGRLVQIYPHPDGLKDESGRVIMIKEEIPARHWQKTAYREFARHTKAIAGEITPQSHPEYYARLKELEYLRGTVSDQEIEDRAWADANNVLYTTKHHQEASADNTDQRVVMVRRPDGTIERRTVNPLASVVQAQKGEGRMKDPEGYARMQVDKVEFYSHLNTPEALAQSQKGIVQQMKLREGYEMAARDGRATAPPPLSPTMGKAMEIIVKAPIGQAATPAALARVESELQALGFRDTADAMTKIAQQNELLKLSQRTGPS
jgi:hypothetical protein